MVKLAENLYRRFQALDPMIFPQVFRNIPSVKESTQTNKCFSAYQERILIIIEKARTISMSELALVLNVTKPTATSVVDRLIQMEFAKRVPDLKDRRKVWVKLSSKGKLELSKVRKHRGRQVMEWIEKFSPEDQEKFFQYAEGMNRLIEKLGVSHKPSKGRRFQCFLLVFLLLAGGFCRSSFAESEAGNFHECRHQNSPRFC